MFCALFITVFESIIDFVIVLYVFLIAVPLPVKPVSAPPASIAISFVLIFVEAFMPISALFIVEFEISDIILPFLSTAFESSP